MIYTRRIGILYLVCFVVLISACVKTSAMGQESINSKVDLSKVIKDYSHVINGNKSNSSTPLSSSEVNDFGLIKIAAYLIFGAIGFAAFMYGKKTALWRPMGIGIALMVYPYFVSGPLAVWFIGIVLTAALYFWRG